MDNNIIVRNCEMSDLEELTQFAHRINGNNEHASTFCSNNLEAIQKDFKDSILTGSSFECRNGDQLIGILNCYVDQEKGNTDCSLLIEPEVCYEEIGIRLLDAIRKQLNTSMKYTFFFPVENLDCSNFLKKIGAHREVNEYSLLLKPCNMNIHSQTFTITEMPEEYYKQFIELHDNIFPEVYISGNDITNDIGNNHFVYTMIDNNQIIAYSVLKLKGRKRATAEVVAVREDFRHKGYGRAVLAYLVTKAFEDYGQEYVDLIVEGDNENALRLYLELGFEVESENCCYTVC